MVQKIDAQKYPELFIGVAGPMGVDLEGISEILSEELRAVYYDSHLIRISEIMQRSRHNLPAPSDDDFYDNVNYKIELGNDLCRRLGSTALARMAVKAIIDKRATIQKSGAIPSKVAYLIRQLKRPEEVTHLRQVYGRQFLLISAYGSVESRKIRLEEKIKSSCSTLVKPSEISSRADTLIERDASEDDDEYGQQLRDTFHLADVFIDGISRPEMKNGLNRFVQALFGRNDIASTKAEYGMYAAKSASLRSTDLSRQVGAAIFSGEGELITQGCNEVPKVDGGTYWDTELPDYRDIKVGFDPNQSERNQLLRDIFERLKTSGLLSTKCARIGTPAKIVEALTKKGKKGAASGALVGSKVMDLTEFGRIVHAEMCAVCDAARLGRSIKGATLFCTTFPCHNCAKHLIASGIKKVVFMEPYPKSMTKELFKNEVSIELFNETRVSFIPFLGISHFRYRDIFQKGRRKNEKGESSTWYHGEPRPMIEIIYPAYDPIEQLSVAGLVADTAPAVHSGADGI